MKQIIYGHMRTYEDTSGAESMTEADKLHHLAAAPLVVHANDHGLSAVSGCAFSCKRAVLAGHAHAL